MPNNQDKPQKRTRFAIYARYSSEMQNDMSLEAQIERCQRAIEARGNSVVVDVFRDGAKSGWSLDRDGFNALQKSAERGKFDAVMFWKFDRLARNHEHAVMIKMLLRHEYGLKLYCVEGVSEDDDNSSYGAMMEQMLAVFSAFYSRNLSSETKRGKRQRTLNGEFNGSVAPLGYFLVAVAETITNLPAGLHIDMRAAALVRRAFRMYATGNYSDNDIAIWLNEQPYIQRLRAGKKPIGKEMVRDMLQNRVYTGRVSYAETLYSGTLGEGKKSSRGRKSWYEGKHQGFISDDLFEACQVVRKQHVKYRKTASTMRTYMLHDRVYCARCIANKPPGIADDNYGKMRPRWAERDRYGYYSCLAKSRGYEKCGQKTANVAKIDSQVIDVLSNLNIPEGFEKRVEEAVQANIDNERALKRMEELREIMSRMDERWDMGFFSNPDEYMEKRKALQAEFQALRPVDYDDLIEAADLIRHFRTYWDQCAQTENPDEARQQLVTKIVQRVFVYDHTVIGIALHGDFSIVLNEGKVASQEVIDAITVESKMVGNVTEKVSNQFGSDGIRTRDLHLDRVAC